MTAITIVWNAGFGFPVSERQVKEFAEDGIPLSLSLTIDLPTEGMADEAVAEELFRQTNLYTGPWWDVIEPLLSPNRHHTALSVGDTVTVDGRVWLVRPVGWQQVA
jgi:hypothetical protein